MFKTVIGRGHPEFSTNRQQDAQEFFMHLLSTIDRAEVRLCGGNSCCLFQSHFLYHWLFSSGSWSSILA